MIFIPDGWGSKASVEFQSRRAGKSRANLVFVLRVFLIKKLFLTQRFYYAILFVNPIHSACGMSVDSSVKTVHKCGSEKAFHRIAYEGGKFKS